jgi:DNA-binding CsgD family transcriptional regulator
MRPLARDPAGQVAMPRRRPRRTHGPGEVSSAGSKTSRVSATAAEDRRLAAPKARLAALAAEVRRLAAPNALAQWWDDPILRTFVGQLVAAAGVLVMVRLSGPSVIAAPNTIVGFTMVAGIGFLHCATVQKALRTSTIAFDAVGTAVIVAGTGAPDSPFVMLALAGAWWAAQLPRQRSGLVFSIAFIAAYGLLVLPSASRAGSLPAFVEEVVVLGVVTALSDLYLKIERRSVSLSEAPHVSEFNVSQLDVRAPLAPALQAPDLPVDAVLAAGQLGLTAQQAELLGRLATGLTNRELGDELGLSEAGVRYRLTRLYRALGVRDRHEAASRAKALGLTGLMSGPVNPASPMQLPATGTNVDVALTNVTHSEGTVVKR